MAKKRRGGPEINSSSMADIAFLLLIFFLVTTTIANDRGLSIMLPPPPEQLEQMDIKIPEKNLFKIQVNSFDKVLVEGEPMEDFSKLRPMIKEFILNFGAPDADYVQVYNAMPASLKGLSKRDPRSSDHPKVAIVTYKTDRGTSYKTYIELLDEIQGAYYDIYADRIGVTNARWREIANDLANPDNRKLYDQGRGKLPDGSIAIPMNISIAEPTKAGG